MFLQWATVTVLEEVVHPMHQVPANAHRCGVGHEGNWGLPRHTRALERLFELHISKIDSEGSALMNRKGVALHRGSADLLG